MFDDEQDDFFSDDSSFSQQDFDESSADFFEDNGNFDNHQEEYQIQESSIPVQGTNFGYKTVGVVVALALVIIAFILLSLSSISLVKKEDNNNNRTTRVETQTQSNTKVQNNTSVTSLTNIPPSTYMDYSNPIVSSQGVVSKLSKYLQDGQVIYCIDLSISLGVSSTTVHYYCGYNTFSQVSVGDVLTVDYQQVSETCFSVCTISK